MPYHSVEYFASLITLCEALLMQINKPNIHWRYI